MRNELPEGRRGWLLNIQPQLRLSLAPMAFTDIGLQAIKRLQRLK